MNSTSCALIQLELELPLAIVRRFFAEKSYQLALEWMALEAAYHAT